MQLYEEFKEYEEMWNDFNKAEETDLTEDLWSNAAFVAHYNGAQILGILAGIIGIVVGFAIAPLGGLATIALWVKCISLVIGVLSVIGLFINEDIADETTLEQRLEKIDIMQLAETHPEFRKKIQRIYDVAGPEKASKLISRLEAEIRKRAKPIAKVLKEVDSKDLDANEALLSKKALVQAKKVIEDITEEN